MVIWGSFIQQTFIECLAKHCVATETIRVAGGKIHIFGEGRYIKNICMC